MASTKKTIVSFLIIFTFCFSLKGQDSLSRFQLAFGINYFPVQYFKFFNGDADNGVLFGYHIGVCKEMHKLNVRAGVNFNYYKLYHYTTEFSVGFEGGAEKRFVRERSKWLLNGGMFFFISRWYSTYRNGLFEEHVIVNEIEAGPNLLFGRKINSHWQIFTELNCSWGVYNKIYRGNIFEKNWSIRSYRFLGIGCRYVFKK